MLLLNARSSSLTNPASVSLLNRACVFACVSACVDAGADFSFCFCFEPDLSFDFFCSFRAVESFAWLFLPLLKDSFDDDLVSLNQNFLCSFFAGGSADFGVASFSLSLVTSPDVETELPTAESGVSGDEALGTFEVLAEVLKGTGLELLSVSSCSLVFKYSLYNGYKL